MFETELRTFSVVRRWSTVRTLQRNTSLSDHSFHVALLAEQVAALCDWRGDRGDLLHWALLHDADELVSGDVPGPFKRLAYDRDALRTIRHRVLEILQSWFPDWEWVRGDNDDDDGEAIRAIADVADALDDCLFAAIELRLGNPDFDVVMRTARDKLGRAISNLPFTEEVRQKVYHATDSAIGRHRHRAPKLVE